MVLLKIKPISTNRIWSGKRYMSAEAKQFNRNCKLQLLANRVKLDASADVSLQISFRFGLSRDMDTSNCIKLVEDVICDVLGIDDKLFVGITATKERVKKGQEFIAFDITDYNEAKFLPSPIKDEQNE